MPRRSISPSSSASTTFSLPISTPKRQLTRSRKLRHLEDHEILDLDIKSPPCEGHSPVNAASYSDRSSVDINSGGINLVHLSTAVPPPLPLPDLAALLFVNDQNTEPRNAFRLPSPQEAMEGDRGRAKGRERETNIDKSLEVASRGISQRDARINWDVARNVDHVPFRSTPATGYSSPILSPQRSCAMDLVSSCHTSYQGWSSTEMCSQDMTLGFQCIASQELGFFCHESSLVPSPKMTSSIQTRSASRPTSPVPPKLFVEASNLHVDNSGPLSGHPLPLPPGAAALSPSQPIFKISPIPSLPPQTSALSSPNPHILEQSSPHPQLFNGQSSTHPQLFNGQSSQSPQITPKSELLSRKNQWSKGKLIGRGTFGSVYAATHRETGALCAMKEVELCHDDFKSIESMKQLQQEIMVLSHLKHPNIVQYYGSEIIDDKFYIYLEYIYPGSINKYVRELCGAITESVVRNFTRHILSGLAYLHGMKTIHRDIKGANLLVDAFGVVKLADFGMAKHLTGQATDLSFKGSPYWMAPELMQAVMERDNRSDLALAIDIWSLGCTVIEMLNGRPPWSEYEGVAAMFKVLRESPPIPEKLSIEGKDFLCCCFQRNPAHRPSASKLLEHPFVRNSQQQDSPYHLPPSTSSGTLILDKT